MLEEFLKFVLAFIGGAALLIVAGLLIDTVIAKSDENAILRDYVWNTTILECVQETGDAKLCPADVDAVIHAHEHAMAVHEAEVALDRAVKEAEAH